MTYDGFCAVALAGTFVMLIGVTVGWSIDRWAGWRVRNEEHRVWANFQEGELWLSRTGSRGTVTGQRLDPSPRPRLTDYEYRAIAEGMEQT